MFATRRQPVAKVKRSACRLTLLLLAGLAFASALPAPSQARISHIERPAAGAPYAEALAAAARRFGIPARWIFAVMRIESGGDVRAVSRKGAMGLMQIMPATWAELRARHRLGSDPFDPRDNILAGAAYLRHLHDRYGVPGFLAAYNAGPGRYDAYLSAHRPLPSETIAYVAALAPQIGSRALADSVAVTAADSLVGIRSLLFVARSHSASAAKRLQPHHRSTGSQTTHPHYSVKARSTQTASLFVARAAAGRRP